MVNKNELENKQFTAALAQMREIELARLLDMIEILVQDFRCIPLRSGESRAAVVEARRTLKIWNAEVKRILQAKATAQSGSQITYRLVVNQILVQSQFQKDGEPLEHITVEVSVVCPTHEQIIGYMQARHWHMIARRERQDGPTYSRWQKDNQHYFIDINESVEFPSYYSSQKDAVILLADYDNWPDEYCLVGQLLRGGIIGQEAESVHSDKVKVYFSDMGAANNSSEGKPDGWQALDPNA